MDNKKKLIIIAVGCLIVAVILIILLFDKDKYKTNLKKISMKEITEKVRKKEDFLLLVTQTGCSACDDFHPKIEKIVKENDIQIYELNMAKLNEKESAELDKNFPISGTPTIVFVKEGKEESTLNRVEGNKDESYVVSKLKSNGYLKK